MAGMITARDVYPKRSRVVSGTSYFEMHLMQKEQVRLEKEKAVLLKRMDQLDRRIGQLKNDLQAAEESMKQNRNKDR